MEGFNRRRIRIEDTNLPKNNPENPDNNGIEVDRTRTVEGMDDTAPQTDANDEVETK